MLATTMPVPSAIPQAAGAYCEVRPKRASSITRRKETNKQTNKQTNKEINTDIDLLNTPGDSLLSLGEGGVPLNGVNKVGELLLTDLKDILTAGKELGDALNRGTLNEDGVGDPGGLDLEALLLEEGEQLGLGVLGDGGELGEDSLALLNAGHGHGVTQLGGGALASGADTDDHGAGEKVEKRKRKEMKNGV